MKVVVVQKGAREHYLAAVAMARTGHLAALVTDWYAPSGVLAKRILGCFGNIGKKMLAAKSDELHQSLIIAGRWRTVLERIGDIFLQRASRPYDQYLRSGRMFARRVARTELPQHEVLFIYSYAALDTLKAANFRGVQTILDQIDPGPFEFRLVLEEAAAWPDYVSEVPDFPAEYFEQLRREWELAHVIVVNSEWSRDALLVEGVPIEKIEILPLAFEKKNPPAPRIDIRESGPIRVLWLGQVNIRKGIQYLVEAARLLMGEPVEIIVAGPIQIPAEVLASAPGNMKWLGPVTRDSVDEIYASSDIFVLPTISDGFAITQLEAMANGLPVITTPHCGRVVQDGVTGFLIPARDVLALEEAILRFVRNPDLAGEMRNACLTRASQFTLRAYEKNLLDIIEKLKNKRAECSLYSDVKPDPPIL